MADRLRGSPAGPRGEGTPHPPAGEEGGARRRVRLTLRHSLIGRPVDQRRTVWSLGLHRMGASRVHLLTPSLAGALRKVGHLVSMEEVEDGHAR